MLLRSGTLAATLDSPVDLLQLGLARLAKALNAEDPDSGTTIVHMFAGGESQPAGSGTAQRCVLETTFCTLHHSPVSHLSQNLTLKAWKTCALATYASSFGVV